MINFCTYFDINYIHKGLALYDSLVNTGSEFKLWILCFDDKVYEVLRELNLPHAILISESEFEYKDDLFKAITAFDAAWKIGINKLWRMENHESYAHRGNN